MDECYTQHHAAAHTIHTEHGRCCTTDTILRDYTANHSFSPSAHLRTLFSQSAPLIPLHSSGSSGTLTQHRLTHHHSAQRYTEQRIERQRQHQRGQGHASERAGFHHSHL